MPTNIQAALDEYYLNNGGFLHHGLWGKLCSQHSLTNDEYVTGWRAILEALV